MQLTIRKIILTERTNEQWLADLAGPPDLQGAALTDLRGWLSRRLFFYLRSRSDMTHLADSEVTDMAEDFVQEALLQVQAKLHQFQGRSKFTTWASKIAVRQALAELRRARWRDISLDNIVGDTDFTPAFLIQDGGPGRPEQQAVQSEAMQIVSDVIANELTGRQRTALVAIAVQGMAIEVVAERLGTNRNALYKLVHDARKRLKSRLEERGMSVEGLLSVFSG